MSRNIIRRTVAVLAIVAVALVSGMQASAQPVEHKHPSPFVTKQAAPKDHVFTVGVEDYKLVWSEASQTFVPRQSKLPGALANADDFSDMWRNHDADVLPTLFNELATKEAIKNRLAELAKKLGESDRLWLTISAHGGPDQDNKWCLCAYDEEITEDELRDWLTPLARKGVRVVLTLDSCHSGMFKCTDPNVVVFAGCGADQFAMYHNYGAQRADWHGLFTKAMLEGLRGAAADRDGIVRVRGLHEYVSRRVKEMHADFLGKLTENLKHIDRSTLTEQEKVQLQRLDELHEELSLGQTPLFALTDKITDDYELVPSFGDSDIFHGIGK